MKEISKKTKTRLEKAKKILKWAITINIIILTLIIVIGLFGNCNKQTAHADEINEDTETGQVTNTYNNFYFYIPFTLHNTRDDKYGTIASQFIISQYNNGSNKLDIMWNAGSMSLEATRTSLLTEMDEYKLMQEPTITYNDGQGIASIRQNFKFTTYSYKITPRGQIDITPYTQAEFGKITDITISNKENTIELNISTQKGTIKTLIKPDNPFWQIEPDTRKTYSESSKKYNYTEGASIGKETRQVIYDDARQKAYDAQYQKAYDKGYKETYPTGYQRGIRSTESPIKDLSASIAYGALNPLYNLLNITIMGVNVFHFFTSLATFIVCIIILNKIRKIT